MKYLILLLIFFTSCSVLDTNELVLLQNEKQVATQDSSKNINETEKVNDIKHTNHNIPNFIVDPKEPFTSPQKIYQSSVQNHEWNDGWYNQIKDFYTNGGTSNQFFLVGSAYFDIDHDGDYDMFVTLEYSEYPCGQDCGWPIREQKYENVVLLNEGINENGRIKWNPNTDIIDTQPYRIYRRILPSDLNNDGHVDIIAFVAEDPEEKNNNKTMGGIDLYWNTGEGNLVFEEMVSYQSGMDKYYHGGTLADVNNDGWIDIIGSAGAPHIYLNNQGNFTEEFLNPIEEISNWDVFDVFAIEAIDINDDGFTDLILGTSKKPWQTMYQEYYTLDDYVNHTEILFGKADYPYFNTMTDMTLEVQTDTFYTDNYRRNYCCIMDYSITDYDGDGDLDIFAVAMRDENVDEYNMKITYHENINNNSFVDKTNITFGQNQNYLNALSLIKTWDIDNDGYKEILIENTDKNNFNAWNRNDDGKLYQVTIENEF